MECASAVASVSSSVSRKIECGTHIAAPHSYLAMLIVQDNYVPHAFEARPQPGQGGAGPRTMLPFDGEHKGIKSSCIQYTCTPALMQGPHLFNLCQTSCMHHTGLDAKALTVFLLQTQSCRQYNVWRVLQADAHPAT